jgi:hypothetical protein
MSITAAQATLDDLYREEGKAELIGGRIVRFMATGFKPGRIGGRIFASLDAHTMDRFPRTQWGSYRGLPPLPLK